jgi:hypothetical protein
VADKSRGASKAGTNECLSGFSFEAILGKKRPEPGDLAEVAEQSSDVKNSDQCDWPSERNLKRKGVIYY